MRQLIVPILTIALLACSGGEPTSTEPGAEQVVRKVPRRLLMKLSWSFLASAPSDHSAFDDAVAARQREALVWDPNYVILERPEVTVRFDAPTEEIPDRAISVTLQSGGSSFTALGFLHALHDAVVKHLDPDDKRRRLVSLTVEDADADPVVYRLTLEG